MSHDHNFTIVTVTIEDRDDGGLRVHSDDLPGLVLSGGDGKQVFDCIAPAIQVLLERQGLEGVAVYAPRSLDEILKRESPRKVDMQVHFIVELPTAA